MDLSRHYLEASSKSALLRLPQELRDIVFDHLIYFNQPAPEGASLNRWVNIGGRSPTADPSVSDAEREIPENFPIVHRLYNVSLVCRQLRNELSTYLQSRRLMAVEANLDVVVAGFRFHPTWTCVPVAHAAERPTTLTVNLRILSTEAFYHPDGFYALGMTALSQLVQPFFTRQRKALLHIQGQTSATIPILRTLTFDLCCRDLYTSDSYNSFVKHFVNMTRRLSNEKATLRTSERYQVTRTDPATGITTSIFLS